jgi:uncharacterized protein YciW
MRKELLAPTTKKRRRLKSMINAARLVIPKPGIIQRRSAEAIHPEITALRLYYF